MVVTLSRELIKNDTRPKNKNLSLRFSTITTSVPLITIPFVAVVKHQSRLDYHHEGYSSTIVVVVHRLLKHYHDYL